MWTPGCTQINVMLSGIPQQSNKGGNYSAVSTYLYSWRPVWRQVSPIRIWITDLSEEPVRRSVVTLGW